MNTPTPRTDAEQKWLFSMNGQMQTVCVHSDFSRQLERELANVTQLHEIAMGGWKLDRMDRDDWKAIAVDLAEKLERTVIPTGPAMFRYADEQKQTVARFNAKKGQP